MTRGAPTRVHARAVPRVSAVMAVAAADVARNCRRVSPVPDDDDKFMLCGLEYVSSLEQCASLSLVTGAKSKGDGCQHAIL